MIEANLKNNNTIAKTLGLDDPNGKHPLIKKRWLWWLLAAIIVSMVIFFVVQNRRPEQVQYLTEKVRRGDLVVTVSATGTLAPVKEVQVGIEVSGTIKSVLVDYNDRVTVGQVLAVLDTTRLEAQALQSGSALASARSKVMQTEATLQEAQLKMARLNQLKEISGGTDRHLSIWISPKPRWIEPRPTWRAPRPLSSKPRAL